LQSADDGLLIVFDESSDTPFLQHDSRAQKLLHLLATACSSMQVYMTERLVSVMDRLDFNFSVVVHERRLSLGKLDDLTGGLEQLAQVGQGG
jgi:hypothetical protein